VRGSEGGVEKREEARDAEGSNGMELDRKLPEEGSYYDDQIKNTTYLHYLSLSCP